MQLDKLELTLRPRPANQALDLGYALLRAHAGTAYGTWLTLWLPLMAACAALAFWHKEYWFPCLVLAWWLRALPERAPLYVLSRCVFGEDVTWREAMRAWPKQLGGGWFSMLTWRRPIAQGRSLYTPIWQLEGARGAIAAERRRVLGRNGTGPAAFWFGVCCALFEIVVLAPGFLAFLSLFGNEIRVNPFQLFGNMLMGKTEAGTLIALIFLAFTFAGALMGPIYTACGFTLYLNRRATLEAWDLEIALRQIKRPKLHGAESGTESDAELGGGSGSESGSASGGKSGHYKSINIGTLGLFAACLLGVALAAAPQSATAAESGEHKCEAPTWLKNRDATRRPAQDAQQEQARRDLAKVYDSDDLRGYVCNKHWVLKPWSSNSRKNDDKPPQLPNLAPLADVLKIVFIALLIAALAYLAYRFRDSFGGFMLPGARRRATEVAGLDIRPESLPDDVPSQVLALWRKGELRQALALLYRATISRLAHDDGLEINVGATEGDCSRLAERAAKNNALSAGRLKATVLATQLWLRAAYADRWPDEAAVAEGCRLWGSEFDGGRVTQ